MIKKLHEAFKAAMERGVDLNDEQKRNGVFDQATFRVRYLDETPEQLHGTCIINLAKSRTRMTGARSVVRNCNRIPGPDDFPEPDHHDRKTDHFCYYETSGCQRGGSESTGA